MTNVLGGGAHATYENGGWLNGEPASRAELNRARMRHGAEKELVQLASKPSGFDAGHWNWQPVGGRSARSPAPQSLARSPARRPISISDPALRARHFCRRTRFRRTGRTRWSRARSEPWRTAPTWTSWCSATSRSGLRPPPT
eukprot:scaffold39428_cov72-Phaeocystis_antarctica.AAC.1